MLVPQVSNAVLYRGNFVVLNYYELNFYCSDSTFSKSSAYKKALAIQNKYER